MQHYFKEMVGSDDRNVTYYEILVDHYRRQCAALETSLVNEDEGISGMVTSRQKIEA
jgi:hypothetical protein